MLRLTNLRVPLDAASGSLRPLLEKKLSLQPGELLRMNPACAGGTGTWRLSPVRHRPGFPGFPFPVLRWLSVPALPGFLLR